jgi:hypothetical protein
MQTNLPDRALRLPGETFSFPCSGDDLAPIEKAMESLHENIFSSVENFRVSNALDAANVLVLHAEGRIANVFLFRIEGRKAIVMNETIRVEQEHMLRAARHIFSHYKPVAVIVWRAIQTEVTNFPFPIQRFNYSEDIVISLPASRQAYLASLGNATRKYLVRYGNRLQREKPELRYRVHVREEIDEREIRRIIDFNRARMSVKNRTCGYTEQEIRRLIALARTHGFVVIALIGGQVCAGCICYRVGDSFYMEITAHDPAYDEYRLGRLCCYQAICEAIDSGGKEFHMLWGRDEYKFLFLGKRRDLDNLCVYRSRTQMLLNSRLVWQSALKGWLRQLKLRLQAASVQRAPLGRVVKRALALVRKGRSLRFRRS